MTRQKLYSILRKAGYEAAKFHRSGMVRGWGTWSSGVQVKEARYGTGAEWQVEYNFGNYHRETDKERIERLQTLQRVLLAAGVKCYPNAQETALIIGDPEA